MSLYTFALLPDHAVSQQLDLHVLSNRGDTAMVIAELAEFDSRKLWAPAGYQSTVDYCVEKLGVDLDIAYRWIRVARAGHRFPIIFPALADGRLTQTAVILLAPYLNSHTAPQLLTDAMGRSKSQVEQLLAERFPRPDLPTEIRPLLPPVSVAAPFAPSPCQSALTAPTTQLAPALVVPTDAHAAVIQPEPPAQRAKIAPLSPGRNSLQTTIDDETAELLRRAIDLIGHTSARPDVALVLKLALRCFVRERERTKFAQVAHPRATNGAAQGRMVPSAARREVYDRDGGACTFVGADGHRCGSRLRLELDHIVPVARGGKSTVANLRLRCRVHNQHEAERVFGAGFMARKRTREKGVTQPSAAG